MDLTPVKERIEREQMKGDIKEACRRAGVEESVYRYAMGQKTTKDLRPREIKVVYAMIGILDERAGMIEKIESQCSAN